MSVVKLTGAVDGSTIYVVPGVAIVTNFRDVAMDPKTGQPVGPGQVIMGEAVVMFFVAGVQPLRVKGAPGDVAKELAGESILHG
jgi:hypothetical protein